MLPVLLLLAGPLLAPGAGPGQEEVHCRAARRFLVETVGMAARTEPDTIDDRRTHHTVAGCRVTAAGVTTRTPRAEAERFFEAVRSAAWTRTPDPRDAPTPRPAPPPGKATSPRTRPGRPPPAR